MLAQNNCFKLKVLLSEEIYCNGKVHLCFPKLLTNQFEVVVASMLLQKNELNLVYNDSDLH